MGPLSPTIRKQALLFPPVCRAPEAPNVPPSLRAPRCPAGLGAAGSDPGSVASRGSTNSNMSRVLTNFIRDKICSSNPRERTINITGVKMQNIPVKSSIFALPEFCENTKGQRPEKHNK